MSNMEFYTACREKRPVRLSDATRAFAAESLNGRYGGEAMKSFAVSMDGTAHFAEMTDIEKYDAMIMKIAQEAPLRY